MRERFNLGWLFHYGDEPGADFMGWDDSAWERVTLPHDWAVSFPFDRKHASGTGYLPGGTAWYRKHFILTAEEAVQQTDILFEGIYKHAKIFVNSHYLGQHAYGYTSFSVDVTPYIREGENVVCVRVEHEDVADSRWYTGSGIDRQVWLRRRPVAGFRRDSLFISTKEADASRAVLQISYETEALEGTVSVTAAGQTVSGPCGKQTLEMEVPSPALWSPETPSLYCAEFVYSGEAGGEKECVTFGIRTICFDGDQGFFLNGKNMKIKGVCVHHDAGCLGAAVPRNVWKKRLETLRECGCNAIRTAHNPPDPNLLDLCDEMGFLVMDEAFDEWEGTKNKWWQGHNVYPPKHFGYAEDFPEWHRRDLESMVLRDRNHPSIIMWSIGNEIDYPNDPYVTPLFEEVLGNNDAGKPSQERKYDKRKPDASRLPVVARELVGIVHSLDTTRPVTSAMSFPELSNQTGLADELDLSGYNYREYFYEQDHEKYPGRVILGSENSHQASCWYAVTDHDYIAGQFLWTGIDFLGECKGWPVRISQAGLLKLTGAPKPLYYQRKALWTDEPFVRLAAGSGEEMRRGLPELHFAWEGAAGETLKVYAFTNQPEAELFLNGKSLGKQVLRREDDCCAVWDVPFEAGELVVKAGEAEDCLVTAGESAALMMIAKRDPEAAEGEEVVMVQISVLDGEGNRCAAGHEEVHVQVAGQAELLGLENGKPDDLTPYRASYRSAYDGELTAYVRVLKGAENVRIFAWTESGLAGEVEL